MLAEEKTVAMWRKGRYTKDFRDAVADELLPLLPAGEYSICLVDDDSIPGIQVERRTVPEENRSGLACVGKSWTFRPRKMVGWDMQTVRGAAEKIARTVKKWSDEEEDDG